MPPPPPPPTLLPLPDTKPNFPVQAILPRPGHPASVGGCVLGSRRGFATVQMSPERGVIAAIGHQVVQPAVRAQH